MKTKKKKCLEKNSLYYTEKNSHFVWVFFKILYTLFTFHFTTAKIPLYNTEKNSSFVDVFLEKIFELVLKYTRLSTAMLFVLYNYDIMITLRVLLTRARSGMVICVPFGNGNKTSTGFWKDSTRLPEYYNGTYEYLKSLGIEEI